MTFHLPIQDGLCEAPVALPTISRARFDRPRRPAGLGTRSALLERLARGPDGPLVSAFTSVTPIVAPNLLTNRERDVLKLLEARLSHEEIASTLRISLPTVKRHAANVYRKLSVTRRRQSVRHAPSHGLHPHG